MKSSTLNIAEGCECPECHEGKMHYPPVEGCYCHLSPPCHKCTDNRLTCDDCGWEFIPEPPEISYRHVGGGISEEYTKRPSSELGEGKRIFDYDYDSSSGSTMVWRGKYAGPVTAEDIKKHFGNGSFGHRGPTLSNGRFTYTLITD